MRIALPVLLITAACTPPVPDRAEPLVDIESGTLRGTLEGNVAVYRGIPYAEPPVGPLRWQPPQPVADWTGVRDATAFGDACPQGAPPGITDLTTVGGAAGPYSEDCLTLNVWAPRSARKAPVMLWIHGGSFRMGAGSLSAYDGTSFARDGIVLVTINYRLGNFGYFAHPALTRAAGPDEPLGNYAVMDQIAALAWVQRNAAAFGGDPDNVTVFGESSGGVNVLALLAIERARGLFHKAIVQSGGGWWPNIPLALAEARGVAVAAAAGLTDAEADAEALRALPAESLVDPAGAFIPFVDGRLITEAPTRVLAGGRAADLPLLVGANSGEDSLLGYGGRTEAFGATLPPDTLTAARKVYDAKLEDEQLLRQLFADSWFVAPARWVAARSATGEPSFLYHFSYVEEGKREAQSTAHHGAEIYHVFKTHDRPLSERPPPTERDWQVARIVHGCWASFARSGAPDCPGAPIWPAYDPERDELMEFGNDGPALRQGLRAPELDWNEDWFLPRTQESCGRRARARRSGAMRAPACRGQAADPDGQQDAGRVLGHRHDRVRRVDVLECRDPASTVLDDQVRPGDADGKQQDETRSRGTPLESTHYRLRGQAASGSCAPPSRHTDGPSRTSVTLTYLVKQ